MQPHVLIVDDSPDQTVFAEDVCRSVSSDWIIEVACSEVEAAKKISELGNRLRIAVIDLFLTKPAKRDAPEGIRILNKLKADAPDCYTIVISKIAKNRQELARIVPSDLADAVVSLRYIDTNPVVELRNALLVAEERFELA